MILVNIEDGVDLYYDFFEYNCLEVENIVCNLIYEFYLKNSMIVFGVFWMVYYDCFVCVSVFLMI